MHDLKEKLFEFEMLAMGEELKVSYTDSPRIVTVVGKHGSGKSRLATWLALNMFNIGDEGVETYQLGGDIRECMLRSAVVLVDLDEVSSVELLYEAILSFRRKYLICRGVICTQVRDTRTDIVRPPEYLVATQMSNTVFSVNLRLPEPKIITLKSTRGACPTYTQIAERIMATPFQIKKSLG